MMDYIEKSFTNIYENNSWISKETPSGEGSEIERTKKIREELSKIFKELNIKTLLDLGCGNCNWMDLLIPELDKYTGIDIVEELIKKCKEKNKHKNAEFIHNNILEVDINNFDAILLYDVLVHLTNEQIKHMLEKIKNSNVKYLIMTHFTDVAQNLNIKTGEWRPINFVKSPFNLHQPMKIIENKPKKEYGFQDKTLSIWEVQSSNPNNIKFTIGYIDHNKELYDKYLGPSIKNLKENFDVISTTSEKCPAINYNTIIEKAETDWIILTHQDIEFSSNFLQDIEKTIHTLNNNKMKIGALGLVGRDFYSEKYIVHWSKEYEIKKLETADACLIVINKQNGLKFDHKLFDGLHLYVEDYCVQANKMGDVCTILTNGATGNLDLQGHQKNNFDINNLPKHYCLHYGYTASQQGFAWGDYKKYKYILAQKFGKNVKTT